MIFAFAPVVVFVAVDCHRDLTHVQTFPAVKQLGIIGMLDMGFLRVIRKWALRDGLPIRQIVRRTGVSRNTIKKYLRAESIKPEFRTPDRPSKLDRYAETLTAWRVTEQRKSRKDRRTAKQMHADLVPLGFDGPDGSLCARLER